MAEESGEGSGLRKKRKKDKFLVGRKKDKLLVGEKVEVRYFEDGLKGSWHPGTVIGVGECSRLVEYAEMLNADGSSKLVETIAVSIAVEGMTSSIPKNYRGNIRPLPPHSDFQESMIRYGLCVDAMVDDAWWEGVVFDQKEGSSERLVFFPDQGDQQIIAVDQMRLTLDWNEVSGDWEPRRGWLFLSLIQTFEQVEPLPISVRQIWYDVRSNVAFRQRIGEWIFGSWSEWNGLVSEVINEITTVALGLPLVEAVSSTHIFKAPLTVDDINIPIGAFPCLEGADLHMDGAGLAVPYGSQDKLQDPSSECAESSSHRKCVDGKHSHAAREDGALEACTRGVTSRSCRNSSLSKPGKNTCALSDFISEYHNRTKLRHSGLENEFMVKREIAKNHLLDMGWEFKETGSRIKYYCSPAGECYYSFIKACKEWNEVEVRQTLHSDYSNDGRDNLAQVNNKVHEASRGKESWQPVDLEPEYCPKAIAYFVFGLKDGKHELKRLKGTVLDYNSAKLKAKQHLLALGWGIDRKGDKFRYCSPDGGNFSSLQLVCCNLMEHEMKGYRFRDSIVEASSPEILKKWQHIDDHSYPSCEENMVVDISERVDIEPEYQPQAIIEYMDSIKRKNRRDIPDGDVRLKSLNAKKHLLSVGWRLWLKQKKEKEELRYASPKGKCYYSLITACKACKEIEDLESTTTLSAEDMITSKGFKGLSTEQNFEDFSKKSLLRFCSPSATVACDWVQETAQLSQEGANNSKIFSSNLSEFGELGFGKSHARGVRNFKKRKINASFSSFSIASLRDKMLRCYSDCNSECQKLKKRKASQACTKHGDESDSNFLRHVLRSSKRARQLTMSSPNQHIARTVLSWLIDNDVLLPRQKVRYMRKRDGHIMMEGRISRDGIKCNCCGKVYTLSNFEAHAGSTKHRPAANIFLQDGRSLLQCQMQMVESNRPKDFSHRRMKSDYSLYQSDTVCSVCHDGGTLVLCDYCPSSFHLGCVGLEDVPEGKWFCPSCRCGICGLSEFNSDTKQFTEKTVLYCDQCEREYHVGCLRNRGLADLNSCPEGNWLCGKKCSKIFFRLRKLLGKSNPTALEGLSWTILRSSKENGSDLDIFDVETMTEHHSKLCVALGVLHECFVTIIEPRTKSDLVADLLFNKESELNRLNFWGFYTMLLERGDELISVATFRVYGEKVAEMPLVGTRFQYRRKGMCRLLMDELEKLLSALGVERLLLPAVPQLLETWTTSFGFTRMTSSDRFMFSEYTLLNFEGTTMCQKLLGTSSARARHNKLTGRSSRCNEVINYDNHSIISGVAQTVQPIMALPSVGLETCSLAGKIITVEDNSNPIDAAHSPPSGSFSEPVGLFQETKQTVLSKMIDQTSVNVAPGECSDDCLSIEMVPPIVMMEPMADLNHKFSGKCYQRIGKTGTDRESLDKSLVVAPTGTFKFYKRRILAS